MDEIVLPAAILLFEDLKNFTQAETQSFHNKIEVNKISLLAAGGDGIYFDAGDIFQ